MPEIQPTKQGKVVGSSQSTQAAARDATTGTHFDETGGDTLSIQWFRSSGRGGGTMRYIRAFLYFDTSAITTTVTSATLKLFGAGSNNSADIIGVKSTAFGGDGGTDLADDDFNNVDFGTAYTGELSTWNNSNFNNLTLNSTARTNMQNDDYLIIALVEADSDYPDLDTGDGAFTVDMSFAPGRIKIDYTAAAAGYGNNVSGVASANIGAVKGVATANISKVIGV